MNQEIESKKYTAARALEEIKAWIEKNDPEIVYVGTGFPTGEVRSELRISCIRKGYAEAKSLLLATARDFRAKYGENALAETLTFYKDIYVEAD